jgi:hypothetical protein
MPLRRSYLMECSSSIENSAVFVQDLSYPDIIREENRDVSRDSQEAPNEILITNIRDRPKFYCMRSWLPHSNCRNYDIMDCSVTFTVDRNIFILGVQVPSQINIDCYSIVSTYIIVLNN